ncbi:hypothetical protein PsorP6_013878 [Peronosclerospora sorghi]|uniref:Uncharacterized protein n=1 Tax=Peronosclerospora sorghi TaxID=230839 RepID=A0ACC0VI89_9STRA|nr:hypothetical protein PsorP6_013878 [Peronosclerospora sorghi]
MKLAKAASLQLKGVIIEYDVLCSTLLGKSVAEQVQPRRHRMIREKSGKKDKHSSSSSSFFGATSSIKSMLVSDVRGLLKELSKDSTGKPWVIKERLESTLQGLPHQILKRVSGFENKEIDAAGKKEYEIYLEKHLHAASEEVTSGKQQKEQEKLNRDQQSRKSADGSTTSSLRDKYLDKIKKLKEKKQQEGDTSSTGLEEVVAASTSAGLSTWLVNEGANEVLSYSDLRGLFKALIPPRDALQNIDGQFDVFSPKKAYEVFPNPKPIFDICHEFGVIPSDVLVLARHAPTIQAAKYVCSLNSCGRP